jgi:hypothetical protein
VRSTTAAARTLGATVRSAIGDMPWLLSRRSIEAYLRNAGLAAAIDDTTVSVQDGPTMTFDDLGRLTGYEETLRP